MASDFDAMMGDDSWLKDSPPRLSEPFSKPLNKRSKALNIDDLLKDHYKDKSKKLDRETKRIRTFVSDSEDSDDEEFEQKTRKEAQFEELVECCEKQVHAAGATLEVLKWGERLFCGQRRKESPGCLRLENSVVQTLLAAKTQFTYKSGESEKDEQTAEAFVSEILASGWLLSFKAKLDSEMMCWIFHTMIFTTDTNLERASCELLCYTLESDCIDYSWIPSYDSILEILKGYGYVGRQVSNSQIMKDNLDSKECPPRNLGSFLRFLMTSLRKRHLHQCYPREDVEKLAVLISSLSLDRSLLCFGILVQECLDSILNSLTENEWQISLPRIAISMAKVDRQVVNCLKLIRTLHSREVRMKSLQSLVALHSFAKVAKEEAVSGVWEMLSLFRKIDVKRTIVDFASLYYQMSMADIWLWSNPVLKSDSGALESWLHFLKSCSFQISSTDWRPYATKVRNQASYLLQVYQCYYQTDEYEET
eukprot:c17906_g1_i1 orf=453-1886(-)